MPNRFSPGCKCCGPPPPCEAGRICVTVQATGCAYPITGITVTVTDDDSPPNVIGTPVTVGVIASITAGSAGSGYTNGTGYPLGISGDGSGAAGTFDVVGGAVTNIVLTDGGSSYSTATITFPGAGGSGATATATIKGKTCIALLSAGTYHVTAHIPGATDVTTTVNATCGIDNNVTLTYPTGSIGRVCFIAEECDCTGIHGVSADVSGSGTGSFSGTADATTGQICFVLGTGGGYSATVTHPSGYTKTTSFSVVACTTTTSSTLGVSGLVIRASQIPPGCTVTLTLTGAISGVCVATSPFSDCCFTFATVDYGTLFNIHYQSSGGSWDNNSNDNALCYPASAPLFYGFLNIC